MTGFSDFQRGDKNIHPRAASEVKYPVPFFQVSQVKIVSYAGKGFDGGSRNTVEIGFFIPC